MSDSWIVFAPKDPDWVPPGEAEVESACAILERTFPTSDGIERETSDAYNFVWNGENWEGVFCPFCRASAEDWWADTVSDHAEGASIRDLNIVTKCCSRSTTLNDLDYPERVAFSRFALSIMNPDDPAIPNAHGVGELPDGLLKKLEEQLGTNLVVVRRRL